MAATGIYLAITSSGEAGGGIGSGRGDRIAILELNGAIGDDRQFLKDLQTFRKDGSIRVFDLSANPIASPHSASLPGDCHRLKLKRPPCGGLFAVEPSSFRQTGRNLVSVVW